MTISPEPYNSKTWNLNGSLQSLDWTGGLDWWTGLKIFFLCSLMRTHLWSCICRCSHSFTDSSKNTCILKLDDMYTHSYKAYLASFEASTVGNADAACNDSDWLLDHTCRLRAHIIGTYGSAVKVEVYKSFIQLQASYVASD